jgi:energy-coupling factor transporter ATP-binding protein EcfA2
MTGSEPFAPAAVSDVVVPIYEALWGSSGKVLGLFGSALDEETQQTIVAACKQYEQNYVEQHGILNVLGRREPVPLESVYSAVQFLDIKAIPSFESVETREAAYRQAQQRSDRNKDYPKQDGLKVAHEKQYLMVLGGPGAGKSTFLRWMALEALKGKKGKLKHACIPVLIELKRLCSGEINIDNEIAEEFRRCGFPSYQEFTTQVLEQGKLLILLDGLDEVPAEQMSEVVGEIQKFVDSFDQNRFIVSCRMAEYCNNFRRFTDVAIADFDQAQSEQFITDWLSHEPQSAQDCWEQLNQPAHERAKELTQTPLLLTLLCALYQHSCSLPINRASLYERSLRISLEQETAEPAVPQEDLNEGLNTRRKEMMLSKIAHDAFQAERWFLPKQELINQIEQWLGEILPDETSIDGADVLKFLEQQPGILVALGEDNYSFSHLTLQEYLTAQYIDDHRQIEPFVCEHLTDKRWREVFLLLAEIMGSRTDELLLSMEKEAQKYIHTPTLQALLDWAEGATTGSEGDFTPAAKRAIAIAKAKAYGITRSDAYSITYTDTDILANALADAKTYAIANANVIAQAKAYARSDVIEDTIAYIDELDKLKIFRDVDFAGVISELEARKTGAPTDEQPPEVRQAFANYIVQSWLDALNLSPELVSLSTEEAEALRNYFYANWLIVQCKQAAVGVSSKVWEAIEDRMLLVPGD